MYSVGDFKAGNGYMAPKIERLKAQMKASTECNHMESEDYLIKYYNMFDNDEFNNNLIKRMVRSKKHIAYMIEHHPHEVLKYT